MGWGRMGREAHYGKDPRQTSGLLPYQPIDRTLDVRPHLTALLWDNSEAQLLIIELKPDIFAQRREGRGQSWAETRQPCFRVAETSRLTGEGIDIPDCGSESHLARDKFWSRWRKLESAEKPLDFTS